MSERKSQHFVYIKLFFLMGISWIVGFIAPFLGNNILWYVFVILNSLQGVFIFVAFVMNKRNMKSLCKICWVKESTTDSTAVNSQKTQSKSVDSASTHVIDTTSPQNGNQV